jgi:predicted PurR-regulated permease PerM
MAKYYKYIIFIAGALIVGLIAWYFQSIISYILISTILSLMGAPLVAFLSKVHFRKWYIPKWVSATLTLIVIWVIFIAFFKLFVPVVAGEAEKLSSLNTSEIMTKLTQPLTNIDQFVNRFGLNHGKPFSSMDFLSTKVQSVLETGLFADVFGSLASTVTNLFIAAFSITFITFFFLKDEGLFNEGVLLFVPPKYEETTRKFLSSTKELLVRYFIGIGIQTVAVIFLTALGLYICGIDIQTSLVISLFAGITNVIPYIGPLIGAIFGLILGLASQIQTIPIDQMPMLLSYIGIVFLVVRLIDNFIFQPFIFSSSINAHPLEVFLVILIAGHIGGITGMLVAIPGYTVLRVFAKEFLNNFAVVKKLTDKI